MATQTIRLSKRGQVTIPIAIRRQLGLGEGDLLSIERQGDQIVVQALPNVVQATAGIFASYRRTPSSSPAEERAAFEQAVADEVAESLLNETQADAS